MDEETLVSTLLNSVAEKLQTRLFIPNLKANLIEFTRALFAVLPGIPASSRELFEKPSQGEQISQLQRHLVRLPIRVAVLLDDMDRMQRKELDALLRLIRGVPNFPKFTFVCAFHPDALLSTLQSEPSLPNRTRAEEFLEKFFPLQIPLPKIEPALLAVVFEKRFFDILDRSQVLTSSDERQKFKDEFRVIWHKHIKGYLTNLRRLNLFVNRINETLPTVSHEINVLDFVLLELIRMIDPIIYEEIFRNARYFIFAKWRTSSWLDIVDVDDEQEQKRRNEFFEALFERLPKPPAGIVIELLGEIFPTVHFYLEARNLASLRGPNPNTAEEERRIYHPDFFPRYFMLQVPQDLFGEKDLSNFISAMNKEATLEGAVKTFESTYGKLNALSAKRWHFLHRVGLTLQNFSPNAVQALPVALSALSSSFTDSAHALDEPAARKIIFAAVSRLGGSVGEHILENVIRDATSDRFATEVLNESDQARAKHLLESSVPIHKDKLEAVFRERMVRRYGPLGNLSVFQANGPHDIVPLGRWALCGMEGREQVQEYLRREFQTRHSNVGDFLIHFFPSRKIEWTGGPTSDPLKAIEIYFPPRELRKLVHQYGDSAHASDDATRAVKEFESEFKPALKLQIGQSKLQDEPDE